MSETNKNQDASLDALFKAARQAEPTPSGNLMTRIMADAAEVQDAMQQQSTPDVVPSRGFLQGISDALGGWAGVSTLAACVGLGIVFGFASPDAVMSYVPGAEIDATEELFGLIFESEL